MKNYKLLILGMLAIACIAGCGEKPDEASQTPGANQTTSAEKTPSKVDQVAETFPVLYPAIYNGRMGYIDKQGNKVVNFIFEQAKPFSEGMAAVEFRPYLWGIIDTNGRWVFTPRVEDVDDMGFRDGCISVKENGKWGTVDSTGQWIIPPCSYMPTSFFEGLAVVPDGNQYGYRNRKGQWAFAKRFHRAKRFSEGLAVVLIGGTRKGDYIHGGLWGYIDTSGKVAIPPRFVDAGHFSEGMARVRVEDAATQKTQWWFINQTGKLVIDCSQYADVKSFHDGLAAVKTRDGNVGFIDMSGRVVISPKYIRTHSFSHGLAAVEVKLSDGQAAWGYIDTKGQWIIKPQFTIATSFDHTGMAMVSNPNASASLVIDTTGKIVFPKDVKFSNPKKQRSGSQILLPNSTKPTPSTIETKTATQKSPSVPQKSGSK